MSEIRSFVKPRPAALRLWHWLDALAITGALSTVVLRKTFFSWRTNSVLIEQRVHELGGTLSSEGAVTLARELRAPMWEWHYIFGFLLVGLLLMRFATVLLRDGGPLASLRDAWAGWRRRADGWSLHYLTVKLSYVVFYVVLTFMAVSGSVMYFGDHLPLDASSLKALKEAHELMMWFFGGFVGLHVIGVFVAELRGERGLVSGMIHGDQAADAAPGEAAEPERQVGA